jgi:hypothetical protein
MATSSALPETTDVTAVSCVDVRTGTAFEFHARHLLVTGTIDSSWSPGAGQLCLGSLEGLQRNVVPDGQGGAYVGWVDNRSTDPDIVLQRFTASAERAAGWPLDGRPVCQAPHSQYQLDLASDGTGGLFLAWQDHRDGRVGRVYVQHLSDAGAPVSGWAAEGIAVTDTVLEQSMPRLASDGTGGCYVVWQSRGGRALSLLGQHFTGAGLRAAGWPADGCPLADGPGTHLAPAIASDSLGRALVVWQERDTLGNHTLKAIRLDPDASPGIGGTPATLTLAQADELSGSTVLRSAPDMLVAWVQWQGGVGSIHLQRVQLGAMSAAWAPGGLVLCEGPISRGPPMVLADSSGGFIAWADFRSGTDSDIYVQRFTSGGAIAAGWPAHGLPAAAGQGEQYSPWLANDGEGGAIMTWSDPAMSASAGLLSLMKVLQQGIPRLIEAVARPNQVRIVWRVAAAHRESLDVQRRIERGDWSFFTRLAPDDSGRVVLVDRTAPQGSHVEYRLGVAVEDARMFLESVALDVPRAPLRLTLHRARIDAARNAVVLLFALPEGPAPSVEVIDVAGRRLARLTLDGLDPGEHETTVGLPIRPASGIYFVRLIQGGQVRVAKTALLR